MGLLVLGLSTVLLSWGRPPHLGGEIVRVESVSSGGVLLYGRVQGSFGPLRRGFGQWIGPVGVDLLTADDRMHSLPRLIEETRWQALLWPPNWWRREVWFVESLPPTPGFQRVRIRITDRLGNAVLGPAVSLAEVGAPRDELPGDLQAWARLESVGARFASPVSATDLDLEVSRD